MGARYILQIIRYGVSAQPAIMHAVPAHPYECCKAKTLVPVKLVWKARLADFKYMQWNQAYGIKLGGLKKFMGCNKLMPNKNRWNTKNYGHKLTYVVQ